jgi:RimJ/RimL family protein N-acetyltransferase
MNEERRPAKLTRGQALSASGSDGRARAAVARAGGPRAGVTQTRRLRLRLLDAGDASFVLRLVNDPAWIRYIGDRSVRTLDDAVRYIEHGPVTMYAKHGFGLYLVELAPTGQAIGICGLVKRDALEDVDLGYAFLPEFWGHGYAFESALAVLGYARTTLGLRRIAAVLTRDNRRSIRLLEKLGFRPEGTVRLRPDEEELRLYAIAP